MSPALESDNLTIAFTSNCHNTFPIFIKENEILLPLCTNTQHSARIPEHSGHQLVQVSKGAPKEEKSLHVITKSCLLQCPQEKAMIPLIPKPLDSEEAHFKI